MICGAMQVTSFSVILSFVVSGGGVRVGKPKVITEQRSGAD